MRPITSLLAIAAAAALAGCYVPSAPDEVLYGAVTATNYKQVSGQPDPSFASAPNVMVNPTITVVDDTNSGVTVGSAVQAGLIAQIEKNLTGKGYTLVDSAGAGPETLLVGAYALFGSVELFYSSYWCSWYYYYYCTPTTSYAGSYNYGTLVVEAGSVLVDPGLPPSPVYSGLIWTSASYGVMAGGSTITTSSPGYQKALGSIDQAFAQSPYFTK
jgi:hypothetical protein